MKKKDRLIPHATGTLWLNTKYAICLMVYLLLLSACGSSSPTVSFAVFGDPAEFAAYERLVDAFTEKHPDIEVQLRHIPSQSEYRQKLATEFSAGIPPDVMLLNYRRFATFAAEGGLEALDPYLKESNLIQADDFFKIAIDSFHFDGQLWCIPQNISSLVVYYNRDLFDAAALAYPTNEWTWDDFLVAARALTRDSDNDGTIDQYGVGLSPTLFRLAPFIWQNGGDIVDHPEQPTRLTLDSPQALAAFQWFVDLQVKEKVVPDAIAESGEVSESRFLNGRLGMMLNSRRGVPTYRTIKRFEWDVAPLPRSQQAAGILHSDAYCLSANAQNKDAAWTFIEFANSVAGQTLIAASGRTVPSLRAVAESDAFLDPTLPPANSRLYIDTAPILGRVPIIKTWAGVEESASKEIERAFYGQISVQEAAATADQFARPYFAEANQP